MNIRAKIKTLLDILSMTESGAYSYTDAINRIEASGILSDVVGQDIGRDRQNTSPLDFYEWNKAIYILRENYKQYGAEQIAKLIYRLSLHYCPIKTGNLREHSYIKHDISDNTYKIIYEAEYAAYVHEIIDNFHKPPTQAKFLEDAAYEIYNYLQIPGDTPLFTFDFGINDDGSIYLTINGINDLQFIERLSKRRKEYLDMEEIERMMINDREWIVYYHQELFTTNI